MKREKIISNYRTCFDNENKELTEQDLLVIDWAERLIVDNNNEIERFLVPSEEQLIKIATFFCTGEPQIAKIVDIASACQFVIQRLYENGDILRPTRIEIKMNNPLQSPKIGLAH